MSDCIYSRLPNRIERFKQPHSVSFVFGVFSADPTDFILTKDKDVSVSHRWVNPAKTTRIIKSLHARFVSSAEFLLQNNIFKKPFQKFNRVSNSLDPNCLQICWHDDQPLIERQFTR